MEVVIIIAHIIVIVVSEALVEGPARVEGCIGIPSSVFTAAVLLRGIRVDHHLGGSSVPIIIIAIIVVIIVSGGPCAVVVVVVMRAVAVETVRGNIVLITHHVIIIVIGMLVVVVVAHPVMLGAPRCPVIVATPATIIRVGIIIIVIDGISRVVVVVSSAVPHSTSRTSIARHCVTLT